MKLMFACLAAGLTLSLAPQMVLADVLEPAEAKLAAPMPQPRKVTTDARTWRCQDDVCKGATTGSTQTVKRECAKLVKLVGPLVAYKDGDRELTEAELAACNAK